MKTVLLRSVVLLLALALPLHADDKKPKPKPPGPAKNKIQFVARIGADMNDAVLSPLNKPFARDIRPSLLRLRDDLLDEAKDKPASSPATYNVAVRLVDTWLSTLQERQTRRSALGMGAPPASDLAHGKKTVLHYPDDILTFQREMKDAAEFRDTQNKKKKFFKDAEINNWRLRTEALRPDLEGMYSQFRALKRQGQ